MRLASALVLALIFASALPLAAAAECVRIQPSPGGKAPELDGPGSFGPLDGTVTLDCLKYVGSIEQSGTEYVLIRDERGTVHRLRIGDRMGENSGHITRIDKDAITIAQHVQRGGKWQEVAVKFPKR